MAFDYTDEQLNGLNRGPNVYSVNPDYVDRHQKDVPRPKLVKGNPGDPNETDVLKTPDGQQFKVIKTLSDPGTVFDGMAAISGLCYTIRKLYIRAGL